MIVRRLGRVEYEDGLALMQALARKRERGEGEDVLLLLEHPPVLTLGRAAKRENVLLGEKELAARGVELYETDRGGDVTYHGPGQLVGYPILDLKPDRCDLHRYVRDIEEAIIRALRTFDIEAGRITGLTGVWVGDEKICAIGVRVSSGWITSHGFALNVTTDLSYFGAIVPCGITDRGVTSLARLLGADTPDMATVCDAVASEFASVFAREIVVSSV